MGLPNGRVRLVVFATGILLAAVLLGPRYVAERARRGQRSGRAAPAFSYRSRHSVAYTLGEPPPPVVDRAPCVLEEADRSHGPQHGVAGPADIERLRAGLSRRADSPTFIRHASAPRFPCRLRC